MGEKLKKVFQSVTVKQSIIVILPVVVVCAFGVSFFSRSLVDGMKNEILRGMFSACASYRESLAISAGNKNRDSLEDSLKADTGMDFTYFEGDSRAATSIVGSDGKKPLGTQAAPEVISNVLISGNVYSSTNTDVNGTPYYVVYMPVEKNGEVSGMAFVGLPRTEVEEYVAKKTKIMLSFSVIFIAIIAAIVYFSTQHLISAVNESSEAISQLAAGKIDVKLSNDLMMREDELGNMARTITRTTAKLKEVLGNTMTAEEASLVEELDKAIEEKQLVVYFQPKYRVQGEKPTIDSAEALIRWKHPQRGMISPALFIPLFERTGMIYRLDLYVWQESAAQIKIWKEKFGVTVPISVNVSRTDIYSADIIEELKTIVAENGISTKDLHLEVTESAYAKDFDQLIGIIVNLRALGFKIEMDDFGSGYSSLNMLAELPIDAIKLDMRFMQGREHIQKRNMMLSLIFDIAKALNVPSIAEGVESEEQMEMLKEMGCDVIQGYYFSRPLPASDFTSLLDYELSKKS